MDDKLRAKRTYKTLPWIGLGTATVAFIATLIGRLLHWNRVLCDTMSRITITALILSVGLGAIRRFVLQVDIAHEWKYWDRAKRLQHLQSWQSELMRIALGAIGIAMAGRIGAIFITTRAFQEFIGCSASDLLVADTMLNLVFIACASLSVFMMLARRDSEIAEREQKEKILNTELTTHKTDLTKTAQALETAQAELHAIADNLRRTESARDELRDRLQNVNHNLLAFLQVHGLLGGVASNLVTSLNDFAFVADPSAPSDLYLVLRTTTGAKVFPLKPRGEWSLVQIDDRKRPLDILRGLARGTDHLELSMHDEHGFLSKKELLSSDDLNHPRPIAPLKLGPEFEGATFTLMTSLQLATALAYGHAQAIKARTEAVRDHAGQAIGVA